MYQLPARLAALTPYQPLTGSFPVRLDANESFLAPPDWLRHEIGQRVAALDLNRYPDPYCVELCRAFADFYQIDPNLVVAGNGSDELISLIVGFLIGAGETMVTVSPDFSMYQFYAQLGNVRLKTFEKTDALQLDADALIAFCRSENAKLLLFSNPCNPTSLLLSRQEVIRLVESLPDCLVVADEAYMDFAEGAVLDLAGQYDNLLVLKTCSKALGMAGIRLGFAVGTPLLVRALCAVKSPYNVNSMTQAAGCVLFSHPDYLRESIQKVCASRDRLFEMLQAISSDKQLVRNLYPTKANFVFLQLWKIEEIYQKLVEQGIAVRKMGDYLRISAGSEQENAQLIAALKPLFNEQEETK